jgi:hypothetical protein
VGDHPIIPDYAGPCIVNVVPALLGHRSDLAWLPDAATDAGQVVLLVLDGLGWEQLQERTHLAPVLTGMAGGDVVSVCPTTTATALTSITTGLPPGEHGVMGYRIAVASEVLNVLRWSTPSGDARGHIDPGRFQHSPVFGAQRPPVVTKADFAASGFTGAHLDSVRFHGYRMPSTLVTEVRRLLAAGEPFVYAYYEGVDKVAHEYGLDDHYDAEIAAVDRLVGDVLAALPPGAALVVTSDHGQVDVGDRIIHLTPDLMSHVAFQSGEGRFRWLHARPGRVAALHEAARALYDDQAWVVTRDETIEGGWWGPTVSDDARSRLGDIALVAREPVSFHDDADSGPFQLVGRHGSLTPAEMFVPCLVGSA